MEPFKYLPTEIVLEILSFLEPKDIARVLRVCRRLHSILTFSRLTNPFTVIDGKEILENNVPVEPGVSIYRACYTQTFNSGNWFASIVSLELWYTKTRIHDTTKTIPSLISIFSRFGNLNKLSVILKGVTCVLEDSSDSVITLPKLRHLEIELEAGTNSDLTPISSFIKHCPNMNHLNALNSNVIDTDEIVRTVSRLRFLETLNIKQRIPGPALFIDNLKYLKNLIIYQVPNAMEVEEENETENELTSTATSSLEFLFYSFGRGPNGLFDMFSQFLKSQTVGANLKILLLESDAMFFNQVNFEAILDSCPGLETLMLSSKRSDLVGKLLYYAAGTANRLSTFAVGPYCPWTMLVKDLFEIRSKNNVKDESAIIYGQSRELSVYLYWYSLREDILPHLRDEGLQLDYKLVKDSTIKDKLFDICEEINCLE